MDNEEKKAFEIEDLKKTLEKKINSAKNIVIAMHDKADFDAIGSSIGLSLIAKKYNKPFTIVMNDPPHMTESGVKMIVTECGKEYQVTKKDKYLKKRDTDGELFILTDVNKKNMVCVGDILPDEDNIIIIDHHKLSEQTVKSNHVFVDDERSSASEIVTEVLESMEIEIPKDVANYLYAGISLDTDGFKKNNKERTMAAATHLVKSGANSNKVKEYFKVDFESYRKVNSLLINNFKMTGLMLSLVVANEDIEYTREELAKVADAGLTFGADVSFAVGYIEDDVVGISGRSNGKVDIDAIMKNIAPEGKGGGSTYSGAARLEGETIENAHKALVKELKPYYYRDI